MSAIGPKQTWTDAPHMSAFGGKADMLAMGVAWSPLRRVSFLRVFGNPPYSDKPIVPWSNSTSPVSLA
jgi:hypothetical protein